MARVMHGEAAIYSHVTCLHHCGLRGSSTPQRAMFADTAPSWGRSEGLHGAEGSELH